MDVNGTRFHLLLGHGDWLPRPVAGAEWDDATSSVGLERLPFVFPPRRAESPPRTEDRRGAGRDRHGNWYWVSDDGRGISSRGRHDAGAAVFWPHPEPSCAPGPGSDFSPAAPPPPRPPARLHGLAVTGEHYLVAGAPEQNGLLVFDLAAGGEPLAVRWPAEVPFAPWDIAAAPDGGVWVLDRDNARLWSLDRLFRVRQVHPSPDPRDEPDFTPARPPGPGEPRRKREAREGPLRLQASLSIASVLDPIAVEVLCDGSALVLGRDGTAPVIHRFTLRRGETSVHPLAPLLYAHPEVIHEMPYAHEFAFVPAPGCSREAVSGRVLLTSPDGNQAFAFTLAGPADELWMEFDPRFFPMRRHGGRALVVAGGEAHYDSGTRWVSLLEYPLPTFGREAKLVFPALPADDGQAAAFDGREPGCVWHRLFLDGCIPPEASVVVESRAAETRAELASLDWSREPAPYLRAEPELPYRTTYPPGPQGQAGTWELLFQNAVGRYLQLRVTLTGNGRITPRLRALRAYYPRFSYLREYLPAVYREDAGSAWFLDRYLANVEGTFTGVEERIAAAQVLFDTRTVPPEFLEWLAGWMGAATDAAWSEEKKRFFLAHAMEMFAGRGTRQGMIRALRLALDECVDPHLFDDAGDAAAAAPSTPSAGGCGCGCSSGGSAGIPDDGGPGRRFTVRVVEQFLTRDAPGVAYGDVGGLSGPGTTTTALQWTPAQGPEPLHARWREWLAGRYAGVDALNKAWGLESAGDGVALAAQTAKVRAVLGAAFEVTLAAAAPEDPDYESLDDTRLKLPPTTPRNAAKAADWTRFLREGLGFTWAVPDAGADLALWRDYLARRYRQPGDLARAWGRGAGQGYTSWDEVGYPAELPDNPAALGDWTTFVSVVVPLRRAAHRFSVLVPVAPGDGQEAQRGRLELAHRIALLEKPAHTIVSTRLYWAAFRVGEARLGTDTLLGQGSRFTSLVLAAGELAGSHLGWTEPWNVRGRRVVGRDPAGASPQSRGNFQRWT